MLHEHLKKLDDILDPAHIAQSKTRMKAALLYKPVDRLPIMIECPVPGWPTFSYREGFYDMEKMLLNELSQVWVGAHVRDDRMYTIRANYGVGIVPSMFGCEIVLTDDNAMPWCYPISDKVVDEVLESGEVDIEAGLGSKVAETMRFYQDVLSDYENISRCVNIYCCDTQGPFDIAHLVMGPRIYTEVYDNPDRVHRLLEITSQTYIRVTRAQKELTGEGYDWSYHSQMMSRGGTRLCDDTATNLSTACYREFLKGYNERVLCELGGGWVHYCGDGRQIRSEVLSTRGALGINFGNPEMQDIADIYDVASKVKIPVLRWRVDKLLPEHIKTGITLTSGARNLESARKMLNT